VDLMERTGPLTLEALADELEHRRPRDLRRRTLQPLLEAGVVDCVAGEYCLSESWRENLDRRREEDGEIAAARKQTADHKRQQDSFREAWERGEVVSAKEFARRRRNRNRIRPDERHPSGTIGELERVEAASSELVEALAAYLDRHPRRRDERPSWLAVALWADEYLPDKPTPAAVEVALYELRRTA
jgi:hypothetical protein